MSASIWNRFAQKSIVELANVQAGEVFTVLTDDWVNPDIAEALFAVGISRTANTQLLTVRSHHYSEEPVSLNTVISQALKESDVVLGVCKTRVGQTAACREALSAGTRILLTEPEHRESFLLNGLLNLDYETMLKNSEGFRQILQSGNTCKVTSSSGTELEFSIGERPIVVNPGKVSTPGVLNWFPGSLIGVAPTEDSIRGVIAVDGSLFPYGILEDPVFLEIERGVIHKIRGGELASKFASWLASLKDDIAYRFCHFSVGFNPRAEIKGAITEDERCLGAVTIGFGRQPAKFKGAIVGGEHHIDVILRPPVIAAGGKIVLENGSFSRGLGLINM